MELLEGRTLESWLMHYASMPLADAPRLVTQIARALEEAHAEGVVHRDLKPGNIFLARDEDGGPLVKLLDFGIARAPMAPGAAPSFATAPGVLFGTPGYMSPEQAGVPPRVDRYCDLWALATVAYELLTGELPVPGATPVEMLLNLREGRVVPIRDRTPELPGSVGAFFQKAFAPRPEDRYASARELALAFERAGAQPDAVDDGDRPRGRAAGTVRMHTLRMDIQAWVSSARSRPHRTLRGRTWVAGLVLLGIVVAAAAWRRAETAWRPAAASSPAPVIEPAAAASPVVVSPPTPDDSPRAHDVLPPSLDATHAPQVRPARRPVPSPPSADNAPAEAAAPVRPNCTTPFWFDPSGTKRWKTECL
jgi:serine/threonine-protein kinase